MIQSMNQSPDWICACSSKRGRLSQGCCFVLLWSTLYSCYQRQKSSINGTCSAQCKLWVWWFSAACHLKYICFFFSLSLLVSCSSWLPPREEHAFPSELRETPEFIGTGRKLSQRQRYTASLDCWLHAWSEVCGHLLCNGFFTFHLPCIGITKWFLLSALHCLFGEKNYTTALHTPCADNPCCGWTETTPSLCHLAAAGQDNAVMVVFEGMIFYHKGNLLQP